MNSHWIDLVGSLGAVLILVAYFMATTKRWQTHSVVYQASNLCGASFLILYSFSKAAYVNLAINVVWASVAIVGLVFMAEHRRRGKKQKR